MVEEVERTGFEAGLFSEWRDDPEFVLNDQRFAGAAVLVAGANFGTGSSREHAVWAIQQYGFQAVISSRFGPIFFNNAANCGLVPVTVSSELGSRLLAAIRSNPQLTISIDVGTRVLEVPELEIRATFPLADAVAHRLVNGLDDIGVTLEYEAEIAQYEATRPAWFRRSA